MLLELTKENLDMAIKKCQATDHYRVLIVTESLEAQEWINDNWLRDFNISMRKSPPQIRIQFPNGSSMIGIATNNPKLFLRGRRANLILCEPWILSDEDMRYMLLSCEMGNLDFKLDI